MKAPKALGWKCRKYIRWDQIQEGRSDREILKKFADSLIDDEKLETKYLADINRIFEKVQRWRKDPDALSLEPDLRAGYETFARTLHAAEETPTVMRAILERGGWWSARLEATLIVDLFLLHELKGFLNSFPGAPKVELPGSPAKLTSGQVRNLFSSMVGSVYREFGLAVQHGRDSESLIQKFLEDLGLGFRFSSEQVEKVGMGDTPQLAKVLVEYLERDEEILVSTKFVQGQLIVQVNPRHTLFDMTTLDSEVGKRISDVIFFAIGEAVLDMLGDRQALEEFFAYLGLNLSRQLDKLLDKNATGGRRKPKPRRK